jgi:hypothetical protein
MSAKYTFCLLRYVPDPVTQEFATVGVVISIPSERFLKARLSAHYGRITRMFGRTNGASFRSYIRHLQTQINSLGDRIASGDLFEDLSVPLSVKLSQILPPDDSAFRFVPGGAGVARDPEEAINTLYQRYIGQYEDNELSSRRDDEDVWKIFRTPIERGPLSFHLEPKTIRSSNYEYEFEHSWRNGVWHLYEPISLDLGDSSAILDKANRWLGRITTLSDSPEQFKLFCLLGRPRGEELQEAYQKAQNILNKAPAEKELIREEQIESFARRSEQEFTQYKRINNGV